MRLISYLKNPIDHTQSGERDYLEIRGISRLRTAFKSVLTYYSWIEGVSDGGFVRNDFTMSKISPVEHFDREDGSVEFEAEFNFPCSGIITRTGEGYVVCPAIKIEPANGQSIVLMFLAPRTSPYVLVAEKTILAIPNKEAAVAVTTDNGEIRCAGNILGKSKSAFIIMNRNPGLPFYRAGFNETLSVIKGEGRISAIWRPVGRNFEKLVLAFHPSRTQPLNSDSMNFDNLARYLGAPETGIAKKTDDYIVGDGARTHYTLRLRLDRGLRRHDSDEARVEVS